ncbi:Argonaute complex, subunit Arb1 [Naviculisporaceae sp. PSN 640]
MTRPRLCLLLQYPADLLDTLEFFCDPPMTPDEYQQERTVIYPQTRPFVDRIEECIQRFRARRRMGNDRDRFFSMYLALGGIDCTIRQFQSTRRLGEEDLEGLSKSDVREITADDVVQRGSGQQDRRWYNPEQPEDWEVDFTGVAASFCSVELSEYAISSESEYRTGVETIYNFLKYVDAHDVCPEYTEDVKKAQKICETALEEMPTILEASSKLPGLFNTAAAHIFADRNQGPPSDWDSWGAITIQEPMDTSTARMVFGSTLAILFDKKLGDALISPDAAVVDTEEGLFEIVNTKLADDNQRTKYKAIRNHLKKAMGIDLETCGTLTVRGTTVRDGWENPIDSTLTFPGEETFILEEDALENLKVGQTILMTVCTTNVSGFKFIKSFRELRPTFWTFLPQHLMTKFKEPVPNPRPAPSIHGPDYQQELLADIPLDGEADGLSDDGAEE